MGLLCEETQWKGRDALRITNGILELISLLEGGHLTCFRFIEPNGEPSYNVLWEAPWELRGLNEAWNNQASLQYGPLATGKFLAGYTGHALCLDYFGDPDPKQAVSGLGLHGEAAVRRWYVAGCDISTHLHCRLAVNLPIAHLRLERNIQIQERQSVIYVQEHLYNERDTETHCNWVQHVTFGSPFLSRNTATVLASATSGATSHLGYGGKSLLPVSHPFTWPFVQLGPGSNRADLRTPFARDGKGFLLGMALDPSREIEFLLAINWSLRLGVGYFFRRDSFPWMTVWEENCSRQEEPWKGTTRARGMEFGTVPLPRTAGETFPYESFSNAPTGLSIPAHEKRTAPYIMALFQVPKGMRAIEDVVLRGDTLSICAEGEILLSIPARDCEAFLS